MKVGQQDKVSAVVWELLSMSHFRGVLMLPLNIFVKAY